MKTVIVLLLLTVLAGCSSLQYAGNATYRVKPVEAKDGSLHCCDVEVYNGKEIAFLQAHISLGVDGAITVDLVQQGVAAFEGQKTASIVAQESTKVAATAAAVAGGVLAAPAIATAVTAGGLPAAAVGAAAGASAMGAITK